MARIWRGKEGKGGVCKDRLGRNCMHVFVDAIDRVCLRYMKNVKTS